MKKVLAAALLTVSAASYSTGPSLAQSPEVAMLVPGIYTTADISKRCQAYAAQRVSGSVVADGERQTVHIACVQKLYNVEYGGVVPQRSASGLMLPPKIATFVPERGPGDVAQTAPRVQAPPGRLIQAPVSMTSQYRQRSYDASPPGTLIDAPVAMTYAYGQRSYMGAGTCWTDEGYGRKGLCGAF